MKVKNDALVIIGENFNATRKIKASSPRVLIEGNKWYVTYTNLDGTLGRLDVTATIPEDPNEQKIFAIPHIAEACRQKDMDYIVWAIKSQEASGAHIIDLCVDEMSVYPEERYEWLKWLVKTAQSITTSVVSIDSSDSNTIYAGLEAHDGSISRPAINSFNLEDGRQVLVDMARDKNAILFANASGNRGMPKDADERIGNLEQCMQMMDEGGIPMEDRFLDPLVFPIGAGPDFGNHYLDAVSELRRRYPFCPHFWWTQQCFIRTSAAEGSESCFRLARNSRRLRLTDDRPHHEPGQAIQRLHVRRQFLDSER